MLYAPVVQRDQIDASIAYLARRLDENTAPENFLRALFTIRPGSEEFADAGRSLPSAVADRHSVSHAAAPPPDRRTAPTRFANEPDSDPTDSSGSRRLARRSARRAPPASEPPIVDTIDGDRRTSSSGPRAAARGWATGRRRTERRRAARRRSPRSSDDERFDTIQIMAAEAAKVAREGDPEVSEAIDFAEYYGDDRARRARATACRGRRSSTRAASSSWRRRGTSRTPSRRAACSPRWPPGTSVILKPPPEARRTALHIVAQLHRAGVPDDVVQFVACPDDEVGQHGSSAIPTSTR